MNTERIKTLAQRLAEGLEIRNMKQIELSEKTGISRGAISSYLTGRWEPKQNNIYLIAKALNVNEAWLMGYDVPYQKSTSSQEGYYTDPETAAYAEELRTNPNLRIMFSAAKDITKEQMQKTVEYIEFLKSKEKGNSDEY